MIIYSITNPGGSDTYVQYNNGGIFGGSAHAVINDATGVSTFTGVTVTGNSVLGLNSVAFKPATDSVTFFQVRNAAGTSYPLSVDTTNIRVGIGTNAPSEWLHIKGANASIYLEAVGGAETRIIFDKDKTFQMKSDAGGKIFEAKHDGLGGHTEFLSRNIAGSNILFRPRQTTRMTLLGNTGFVGIGETVPETLLEMTHATPYITTQCSTHINNLGRISRWIAKGNKLDETEHTLGIAEFGHDGTGDDYDAYWKLSLNGTTGGVDTVVDVIKVDSLGTVFETGPIFLKETTTPTARTNYAAIYTTSDNELFWQDGAGTEHLLHGDSFSEIWYHGVSTVEVTISAQNAFTIIDSFTVVGHEDDLLNLVGSSATNNLTLSAIAGGEYEISYHGSITATGGADKTMMFALGITLATPKDITNVTDDTVSPIVITSIGHGLEDGDMVEIAGVLVNTAANGSFIVDSKANDTFEIVKLDGSATTGNGDYDEGTPTGDVTIVYPGNMVIKRAVRGADLSAVSATGLHIIANSDVLALYIANISGATNLTVDAVSLDANRIGD